MSMAEISYNVKNNKYFWRGSTPTYKFNFADSLSKFKDIEIGFSQDEKLILKKSLSDCDNRGERSFSLMLKNDETMKFEEGDVTLQLQVTTNEDLIIPSNPHSLYCKDTVFSKENDDEHD